jgi:hypothetical protein
MKPRVYLTRRDLLTLLSKLDRKASGDDTACTILKNDNKHPKYPQTMASIDVVAVEDAEYYTDRLPGDVHPLDESVVITAAMVLELRTKCQVTLLTAKKALVLCGGDMTEAEKYLRDGQWLRKFVEGTV